MAKYKKVDTDLKFVDREKELKNSGMKKIFSRKVWRTVKKEKLILSTMDLRQQMVNRISDTFLPV